MKTCEIKSLSCCRNVAVRCRQLYRLSFARAAAPGFLLLQFWKILFVEFPFAAFALDALLRFSLRNSLRRILPETVLGRSANSMRRIRLYGARFAAHEGKDVLR